MVVTPDFVPGALVTLSSFLKHHPQPGRPVFLLQRDLGAHEKRWLETLPFDYHFLEHDSEIASRVQHLPIPPERRNRLLVLQAFQVRCDTPLIVLDADLLIQGSLSPLLNFEGGLVGSGESLNLEGGWRHGDHLEPGYGEAPEGALTRTINTGVFRLNQELRTEVIYRELLDRLEPVWWRGLKTDLTDQALLNHHLKNEIRLAPAGFNYVLRYREIFERASGMTPDECPVLHFAGPLKPWEPHRLTSSWDQDFVAASKRWHREWLEVMSPRALNCRQWSRPI